MKNPNAYSKRTAFPSGKDTGISLLDYFAARAPKEIPDWFKPNNLEYEGPSYPAIPNDASEGDREMMMSWMNDPNFDLPDEYEWFAKGTLAVWEAKEEHKKAVEVERYFAWPWYWANNMLISRGMHNEIMMVESDDN